MSAGFMRLMSYMDEAGRAPGDIAADIKRKDALLREALEALYNLAPIFRERKCFGDRSVDCECTACKIRRELGSA